MEKRTITVKGIGKVKLKVDYIVISLELSSLNKDYEKTMSLASSKLNSLTNSLVDAGFEKQEIKTAKYEVQPVYESIRDEQGNYRDEFLGFKCVHMLKLSFDFDMPILNKILLAITKSEANPKIHISFTVKDQTKISDEVLKLSCEDAKRKAEILCNASGYSLGALLKIDYNWNESYFESRTRYENTAMFARHKIFLNEDADNIEPEDIEVSDSAVFIWEIV